MKKKLSVILAAMLALTLTLGLAPLAFADDPDPENINTAAITKVLKVPFGTEYPAMTFDFSVSLISFNDNTTMPSGMPVIGTAGVVSIAFDGTAETLEGTVSSISTYYLESDELFGSVDWPYAGIYEFVITETGSSYYVAPGSTEEALDLSQAEYNLKVYVKEYTASDVPAGSSIGDRYIFAIGVMRTTNDDGTDGSDKVDPTPGGNGTTTHYS